MNKDGSKFIIQGLAGKRRLVGRVRINGAKNDALPALAASLLCRDRLEIENLPIIDDVTSMLDLLTPLGVTVKKITARQFELKAPTKISTKLHSDVAKHLRGAVILTGPILGREGEVTFPHPGGCVIGARPIDAFLDGFRVMGATVREFATGYHLRAPPGGLRGGEIFFKNQTVTGTETLMMTALLARGRTVLKNCASEPEVINLGHFLIRAGAAIRGLGSSTIEVTGGARLRSGQHHYRVIPDRIEAGSFLILGALAGRVVTITHCEPTHLEAVINLLKSMGAIITIDRHTVTVRGGVAPRPLRAINVTTHEYPGFPTDLQALVGVLLTQATGESLIFETIFEGRLSYLHILKEMGATVTVHDPHRATILGPTPLNGRHVYSPDLRAGLAYILAAIVAQGETVVHNVHYVERGYERVEEHLRALGVDIVKVP